MASQDKLDLLRVTHDPHQRIAYIGLTGPIAAGAAVKQVRAGSNINLDFDADGRLLGIELLSDNLLHPSLRALAAGDVKVSSAELPAASDAPIPLADEPFDDDPHVRSMMAIIGKHLKEAAELRHLLSSYIDRSAARVKGRLQEKPKLVDKRRTEGDKAASRDKLT